MNTTAYTVLGLTEQATDEEISAAFRKLARQHHPDRGGDPKVMARIAKAYHRINTPEARLAYGNHLRDLERASDAPEVQAPTGSLRDMVANLDPESLAAFAPDKASAERIRTASKAATGIARGVDDLFKAIRG